MTVDAHHTSYWARDALFFLSSLWLLVTPVSSRVVNRTIDDTFGDSGTNQMVTFLPTTANVWEGASCEGCAIQLDTSQTFKETFTAATYNPGMGSMSIELEFEGIAIWVYFILANHVADGITTLTAANFTLDAGEATLFEHDPDLTSTSILYNQLVYSQTDLVNAKHKLVISTSTNANVWVNFDYAIYTHDDDAALDPSPPAGGRLASPTSYSSTSTTSTTKLTYLAASTKADSTLTMTSTAIKQPSSTAGTLPNKNKDSPANDSVGATQKPNSTAKIVGCVAGGIAGAVLLGLLCGFFMRHRRRQRPIRRKIDGDWTGESLSNDVVHPYREPAPAYPFSSNRMPRHQQSTSPQAASPQDTLLSTAPTDRARAGSEPEASMLISSTERNSPLSPYQSSVPQPSWNNTNLSTVSSVATAGSHSQATWTGIMPAASGGDREDVRRQRQRELDERMRHVQAEMNHLAADMTGQKPSRRQALAQAQARAQGPHPAGHGGPGHTREEDMSMDEMREQLRVMTNQVAYLRNQQQSAWALGLSNDPPPGYTPSSESSSPPIDHNLPPPSSRPRKH